VVGINTAIFSQSSGSIGIGFAIPINLPMLYGAGLRLLECAHLRVKDVDFAANQIVVRAGKGDRDRVTMLPGAVKPDLTRHLEFVKTQHETDLQRGAGWVELPWALARKYPNAASGAGSGCFRPPGSTSIE
jgi:integrase